MERRRVHIEVTGIVQGVGFRPFVYRIALAHKLSGWVLNASGCVEMEVEGSAEAVAGFCHALEHELPPLARLDSVATEERALVADDSFRIRESKASSGRLQLVPPDIATCEACRRDVTDPENRRYGYPFTNCTDCGPRFTIIEDIPYDRPLTTMKRFPMCPECEAEYRNPLNRRFHAQPNACPVCGPQLWLADCQGHRLESTDVVREAADALRRGAVLAPKGLGGFHLAVDATCADAVVRLRTRKRRGGKPFAVMMASLEEVRLHCLVSPAEEALLNSPAAPIVVLPWRRESTVVPEVAPGQRFLGVMLPYTPFHHLLLNAAARPLVMTSGNLSEEPIARENEEALRRLAGLADLFVLHDREILTRCDDSVFMVAETPRPLRRARGYAPDPVPLPVKAPAMLACGAEEKSTFCLTNGAQAFLSQHIGDLENTETLDHFEETAARYEVFFRTQPEVLVHDLHPEYLSTKYALARARETGLPTLGVQHHHAHIAACMAENRVEGPVLGVSFDGTGYGLDGTIWGGEFLLCERGEMTRVGHLERVPMAGGAAAIRRPYRMARAYQQALLGGGPLPAGLEPIEAAIVDRQLERGINSPLTSSAGRLFDAVAALCGLRGVAQYEAQAAIELEMAAHAGPWEDARPYPFDWQGSDVRVAVLGPMLAAIQENALAGVKHAEIAARFHQTMAQLVCDGAQERAARFGLSAVALSGGVFQNRLLLRLVLEKLARTKLAVYTHSLVPCNDGAIAYGQAVVAAWRLQEGEEA